jgi:hypothetical protein
MKTMGTDATYPPNGSALNVNWNGDRELKIVVTLDNAPQKLTLEGLVVVSDGVKGIQLKVAATSSTTSSPLTVDVTRSVGTILRIPAGTYEYVELSITGKRPNPRVVVKTIIPN